MSGIEIAEDSPTVLAELPVDAAAQGSEFSPLIANMKAVACRHKGVRKKLRQRRQGDVRVHILLHTVVRVAHLNMNQLR